MRVRGWKEAILLGEHGRKTKKKNVGATFSWLAKGFGGGFAFLAVDRRDLDDLLAFLLVLGGF